MSGITSITIRAMDHMHRLVADAERDSGRLVWILKWSKKWARNVVSPVEVDGTNQIRGYILQRNESNVAFLKRLAARNNYILRVERDALTFKKPTSRV